MKRWITLGAALLALAGILGGCGVKETAKPSDASEIAAVGPAENEQEQTFREDFFAVSDPTGTAGAGTTKPGETANPGTAPSGEATKPTETEKPKKKKMKKQVTWVEVEE